MTLAAVDATRLLDAIRVAAGNPEIRWARKPERLMGGSWADIFKVRLRGEPGFEGDLVVRILPHPESWEREMLIQRYVARHGLLAPVVHMGALPSRVFNRAWILMDFDSGRAWLSSTSDSALAASVFFRSWSVPALVAKTAVAIHAIDAAPVAGALALPRAVAPVLEWLFSRASALGDRELVDRTQRLIASRPRFQGAVLCHGGLHPLNILRHPEYNTVLDWTHAQYDDPLYDLAFPYLSMDLVPVPTPVWMRPALVRMGHMQARRLLKEYEKASGVPIDRARLHWFLRVVALRILVEAAEDKARGQSASIADSAAMVFEPYIRASGL